MEDMEEMKQMLENREDLTGDMMGNMKEEMKVDMTVDMKGK